MRTTLAWLALFLGAPASAADLILSGGLNYAAPTELRSGSDRRWTGTAAPVGGLSVDLPFSDVPLSFEAGVFLKSSRSERTDSNAQIERANGEWTDIPLLVHYHFDPSVQLGLGGYWSFFRSGNAMDAGESPDSGVLVNLRARIRITEPVSLTLDARYQHGLSNLAATPGDAFNSRSIQVLAGVLYPLF